MNEGAKNRLKKVIGSVGYALLKRKLRNINLKIDAEKKLVTITKNGSTSSISFDEIEQLSDSFSQ